MAQSVVLFSSIELLISVGKGKKWNLTPSDCFSTLFAARDVSRTFQFLRAKRPQRREERGETDVFAG